MNFNHDLINGKCILITGGTTGIGRETALKLASLGGNILVVGADIRHLEDSLNHARATGVMGTINGVLADVSSPDGIAKIFEKVDSLFGSRLDILINNAAVAYGSVLDGGYTDWCRVINTNLLAYIACANLALIRMKRPGRGHIINVGSMSADVREKGSSVYVATKAGVQGFTESLRKEVNEQGVKVTLIEPGAVNTDMQPDSTETKQNAVATAEMMNASDVADAIIYTVSQQDRCDVVELRLRPHMQMI